jgi:nuclear pore complex protein Nup155
MDPYGIGVEFWAAGSPANDPRAEYYERRLLCYDLALDSLSVFERKSAELGAMNGAGGEGKQDADTIRLHAYQLTLASEDPLFHSSFYDWLIGKGLADELLDV